MGRKEMWMTDYNGFEASETLDCVDGLVVKVCDTIPHNVSIGRENEVGALPDGKLWFSAYSNELRVRCLFGVHGMKYILVLVIGHETGKSHPGLTCRGHILARIETYGAFIFEFVN
jgi:hypothetical protein